MPRAIAPPKSISSYGRPKIDAAAARAIAGFAKAADIGGFAKAAPVAERFFGRLRSRVSGFTPAVARDDASADEAEQEAAVKQAQDLARAEEARRAAADQAKEELAARWTRAALVAAEKSSKAKFQVQSAAPSSAEAAPPLQADDVATSSPAGEAEAPASAKVETMRKSFADKSRAWRPPSAPPVPAPVLPPGYVRPSIEGFVLEGHDSINVVQQQLSLPTSALATELSKLLGPMGAAALAHGLLGASGQIPTVELPSTQAQQNPQSQTVTLSPSAAHALTVEPSASSEIASKDATVSAEAVVGTSGSVVASVRTVTTAMSKSFAQKSKNWQLVTAPAAAASPLSAAPGMSSARQLAVTALQGADHIGPSSRAALGALPGPTAGSMSEDQLRPSAPSVEEGLRLPSITFEDALSTALDSVLLEPNVQGMSEETILERANVMAWDLLSVRQQERAASEALEYVLAEGVDGLSEQQIWERVNARAAIQSNAAVAADSTDQSSALTQQQRLSFPPPRRAGAIDESYLLYLGLSEEDVSEVRSDTERGRQIIELITQAEQEAADSLKT